MKKVPEQRKAYVAPIVKRWGTVSDLTRTGRTVDLNDGKSGSVFSKGASI